MSQDSAPTTSTSLPRLGRYQLLGRLGQGGMGEVWLARDTELDRTVALKLLPKALVNDPGAVARFQREARALAKLSHPGIVQAYDSGSDGGRHFLVMEHVEGHSLAATLQKEGKLPPGRAADFAHQAALALRHAHGKGLVHRDLKPSNLLVTPAGQVKLLDLGLARFLQDQVADPGRTREGVGLGTPDYAAPEQFRDAHSADTRSDVYSLGCTLYHLLAGRVPFPGSSLSEKYDAHAHKEPAPLEELCPEAPGGLVLAVQKMMAKRPADRFQSAAEAAEALAPFVAGSSASFQAFKTTSVWNAGQLTRPQFTVRRRALQWATAAVTALLLVGAGFGLAALLGPPPGEPSAGLTPEDEREGEGKQAEGKPSPKGEGPPKVEDPPGVLTVAKKGPARYQTITEALDAVKPGQTVRVLDDEVYRERLLFAGAARHANVTLEAVKRATLELNAGGLLIDIQGVPGVTVRGFRLQSRSQQPGALLLVRGISPGTSCHDCEFSYLGSGIPSNGIELHGGSGKSQQGIPALDVSDCTFRRLYAGCWACGMRDDYRTVTPVDGFRVRNNLFIDVQKGIYVWGQVRNVHLTGNRILRSTVAGIQFEKCLPGSENLLAANNTLYECQEAIRFWDEKITVKSARIVNNLILSSQGSDIVFYDSAGDPQKPSGPGNGKALLAAWTFAGNWREGKPPAGSSLFDKAWVPPTPGDVLVDKIEGVERDPKKGDGHLRPDPKSPLATQGAGTTDPSVPRYVGALPPKGTLAWDWDRTWQSPGPGELITVSKDPKDKAKFDTIGAALKAVTKPWTTIRVLDAGEYAEAVNFTNAEAHTGVSLEAVQAATLSPPADSRRVVAVQDVPWVRLEGFRIRPRDKKAFVPGYFVLVSGNAGGVSLRSLRMEMGPGKTAMSLQNTVGMREGPVSVQNCEILADCPSDGISVAGQTDGGGTVAVRIQNNQISGVLRGIILKNNLADVQVTGNLLWNCPQAGLQIEDLAGKSRGIVTANNTILDCGIGLRIWESKPDQEHRRGQVEIVSNLLLRGETQDMAYIIPKGADESGRFFMLPGDWGSLSRLWRCRGNRRDLSGTEHAGALALSPDDRRVDLKELVSTDPADIRRVRPRTGSSLATQGAGKDDPAFPVYVGALPPEGTAAWDWNRTWNSLLTKSDRNKEEEKAEKR